MLELIQALCTLPGVSGTEDEVRDYIREQVMPYADEIREDALGNLMVFQRGSRSGGPRLMLCAHMDEVGLIVKGFTDDGFLRFGCVGGIDRRVLFGRRVLVGPKKRHGVIGLKARHLSGPEEQKKLPGLEDMLIDIGAADKAEAESLIAPGDACVFSTVPEIMGDGPAVPWHSKPSDETSCMKFLKARAIDDRLGCACLIRRLAEKRPRTDTWTVFTAQEEAGARGAYGAAFHIRPDIAIVAEVTTAADRPDLPPHKRVCSPGGGVVIPTMDKGTIYTPRLTALARALAEERGVPWQDKEFLAGGTDAQAIRTSCAGVEVLGLAVAARYLHGPAALVRIDDFERLYGVLDAVADACDNA